MTDLTLRCRCGSLEARVADVSPAVVNRAVCYCGSCAAYARELGRGDTLDERGGTDCFSPSPATFEITKGEEHVALLRMTRKGALRWYAGCCDTPLLNTLPKASMPFLAIPVALIDRDALEGDVDQVLGPVRASVNGDFEGPERSARRAGLGGLLSMIGHFAPLFFKWKWQDHQRQSPFFDERGRPIRRWRLVEG